MGGEVDIKVTGYLAKWLEKEAVRNQVTINDFVYNALREYYYSVERDRDSVGKE